MSGAIAPDFDFALPPELIARHPPAVRGDSRMLLLDRATGAYRDTHFARLDRYLREGDVLVMNDTRVIPARLFGRRLRPDGGLHEGTVEALLLEQLSADEWSALVRPGRSLRPGARVIFGEGGTSLTAEVAGSGARGQRRLRFGGGSDFFARLEAIGHVPLPPYMHRADTAADRERYQTVIAREHGAVAAPTAGLHFTPEMMARLAAMGVTVRTLTLHVGLGTFAPLSVEAIATGRLHEERYTLSPEAAEAVNGAKRDGRRVVAVGTTVVRTLEHCALVADGNELIPHSGRTSIFIRPGFAFQAVDALLTNFHLPQSSLLMLVSAFAGRGPVLTAYEHAVRSGYRFFSYGDCMFIA